MEQFSTIETKVFRGLGFMTTSKYNNSGSMLYIADKDSKVITCVSTDNYEIVGVFQGHSGVVWNLDISQDDNIMISCSGDLTICFWNTQNGSMISKFYEKCIPKYVCTQKKLTTNLTAVICEAITKKTPTYIGIFNLDELVKKNTGSRFDIINGLDNSNEDSKTKLEWKRTAKPIVLTWLNENVLIIGCDDGTLVLRDINDLEGNCETEYKFHTGPIKSIVWNKTRTQILTGSGDCEAKQIDITNWEVKATYKSSVPINYACWNHNDRKVLIGGGIEAMNVAKTSNNDLNLKIYRTSDQKLVNHLSSHFGPIRYIDKAPKGKNFVSASQDGTAKVYFVKDEDNAQTPSQTPVQTPTKSDMIDNTFGREQLFTNAQIIRFGLDEERLFLTNETNKIENLSWKPKQQTPSASPAKKWIPGMPKPKEQTDNLFQISSNSIELDERIKKLNEESNEQISTIRINNLPPDIRPRELADMFDLYGRIAERDGIKIKKYDENQNTMAFIKYVYPESALKAIENMDGYALDYNIIRVELSRPNK